MLKKFETNGKLYCGQQLGDIIEHPALLKQRYTFHTIPISIPGIYNSSNRQRIYNNLCHLEFYGYGCGVPKEFKLEG